MNAIRKLLLQHRAEVQSKMIAARARAAEPFERELAAVEVALAALDGAPDGPETEAIAASPLPERSKKKSGLQRGRMSRSLREMVLASVRAHHDGIDTAGIISSLERRWNRYFQEARVAEELRLLGEDRHITHDQGLWRFNDDHDAWVGEEQDRQVAA